MRPIVWTDEARADLLGLIKHVAERDEGAAVKLAQRIEKSTWPLQRHPHLFRPGRVSGTREIVTHKNHILVYRVEPACIEVLRVLHARQRYP